MTQGASPYAAPYTCMHNCLLDGVERRMQRSAAMPHLVERGFLLRIFERRGSYSNKLEAECATALGFPLVSAYCSWTVIFRFIHDLQSAICRYTYMQFGIHGFYIVNYDCSVPVLRESSETMKQT